MRLLSTALARAGLVLALVAFPAAAAAQVGEGEGFGLRPTLSPAPRTGFPGSGAGTSGFHSASPPRRPAGDDAPGDGRVNPEVAIASRSAPYAEALTGPRMDRLLRRVREEENPFGPVGVQVGSFTVRSNAELIGGYDDNPFRTLNGRGSRFGTIGGAVEAQSNWSRHELATELRGSYTQFFDVDRNNRPEAEARVRGRIDVNSLSRIELGAVAALTTVDPGTPEAVTAAKRPPFVYTLGGTAGYVQRLNRFEAGIHGHVDRQINQNAELITGQIQDLSNRNYTAYGGRLRGSYEVLPAIRPFAEVGLDRRVYDQEVDAGGVNRDSTGAFARAGVEFERTGFLTGEASVGYTWRKYPDPVLEDIAGLIADASLVWTASGLTTVTLNAVSGIEETTLEDASGMFRHEARITIDHAFRRWLIGSVSAAYGINDYEGADRRDNVFNASAALTYYFNRYASVRGEVRREQLRSNIPGNDYTANIVMVGLRLQR